MAGKITQTQAVSHWHGASLRFNFMGKCDMFTVRLEFRRLEKCVV